MSARQTIGSWLEGTAAVSLHIGPQTRLLDRLGQLIDVATEDFRQAPFQANQAEQPDPRVRVKLRHQVDVAVGCGLTARERTEQAEMADAGALQLRRMRAQRAMTASGVSGVGTATVSQPNTSRAAASTSTA
jgi:hypothetical protein